MRALLAVAFVSMVVNLADAGPRDEWMVGRWRAEVSDGDRRELVLDERGGFSESRAQARRSSDGGASSSSASASSRSGGWRVEDEALVLEAGGKQERRAIERVDGRLKMDGVVYERVER